MKRIIDCKLRINNRQTFGSFVLLYDEGGKPYAEIGADKDGKPIAYFFDEVQIIPDRLGKAGHFEYLQEIIVT